MTEKVPACLHARTAVISLRKRGKDYLPDKYTITFPAKWSRSTLLDYVRKVHTEHTARIVKWNEAYSITTGMPLAWIVNPEAFTDFKKGELK